MALLSITVAFNASANFCGSISFFFHHYSRFWVTDMRSALTHLVVLRQLGLDWHLQPTPRQAESPNMRWQSSPSNKPLSAKSRDDSLPMGAAWQ